MSIIKYTFGVCLLSCLVLVGCQKKLPSQDVDPSLSKQTQQCLKEYHLSYEQLASQFVLFQAAVQKNSPNDAAALVSYPLRVNRIESGRHLSKLIKNTAQLTVQWPRLMNDLVKEKILASNAQDSNQMICNYQGIGFANGAVWFSGDSSAQIYVINNIS